MSSVSSLLNPGEGVRFSVGPFAITSRVLGGQSGGALELYELTLGEATIDYHVHMTMDETICVIAGEVEFTVAGRKFPRPGGRWRSSPEASTTDLPIMARRRPPS